MKSYIISILILCSVLISSGYGEEWNTKVLNDEYYNNTFKKPHFHLGVSAGICLSYYLNYNENNTFFPYIVGMRFYKELEEGEIFLMLKMETVLEMEEYTDSETYYGESSRISPFIYVGVNSKYKSFIPNIKWMMPYILFGGGPLVLDYEDYFTIGNKVKHTYMEGYGWEIGLDIGSDFELVNNLLSLQLGIKFELHFLNHIYVDSSDIGGRDMNKSITEKYFLLYTGFSYNLF